MLKESSMLGFEGEIEELLPKKCFRVLEGAPVFVAFARDLADGDLCGDFLGDLVFVEAVLESFLLPLLLLRVFCTCCPVDVLICSLLEIERRAESDFFSGDSEGAA